MIEQPVLPRAYYPASCRASGCTIRISRPHMTPDGAFDLGAPSTYRAVHEQDGAVSLLDIPDAWLDDANRDIWAEVEAWVGGLHREEPQA